MRLKDAASCSFDCFNIDLKERPDDTVSSIDLPSGEHGTRRRRHIPSRPEVPSGCLLVRQHAVDRGPTYPEALGDPRWRPGWPARSGWRRWRRSATGRRSGRSAGPSRCRAHSIRKRRRRISGRRLKKLAAAVAEEAERHPETRMHGGVGGAEPQGALLSRSQRGCAGHSALKPASSG